MKVLLTGGSGFIGSHILDLLNEKSIKTICVGRTRPKNANLFYTADLLSAQDIHGIMAKVRPTHLIHLAWYTKHPDFWEAFENREWGRKTALMVKLFREFGGKYASIAGTVFEYSLEAQFLDEETTKIHPHTLYGISKALAGIYSKNLMGDKPLSWCRISIPFGPRDKEERLIPSLVRVFSGEIPPFPVSKGVYRDFIHVKDVANGFLRLLESQANGDFNISSCRKTYISDIVKIVAQKMGKDPGLVLNLEKENDNSPSFIANNYKLMSTGWKPTYSMEQK